MSRSFVSSISTPAPTVVQVRQRSFDLQDRYVLEIEFTDAMPPREAGITRLLGMQTGDGGIAMWPGGRDA
jgi:hypothetical protein